MTPLVLIHGIGADGRMFDPVAECLANGARVVVWNLPGYGGKPLDGPLTFPGLAAALASDLDAWVSSARSCSAIPSAAWWHRS